MKKIKVCKYCSNFSLKEIKAYAKNMNFELKFGCLTKCKKKYPEFSDKYLGMIDNELFICASKEAFFKLLEDR